jgi:hypothetical protein
VHSRVGVNSTRVRGLGRRGPEAGTAAGAVAGMRVETATTANGC